MFDKYLIIILSILPFWCLINKSKRIRPIWQMKSRHTYRDMHQSYVLGAITLQTKLNIMTYGLHIILSSGSSYRTHSLMGEREKRRRCKRAKRALSMIWHLFHHQWAKNVPVSNRLSSQIIQNYSNSRLKRYGYRQTVGESNQHEFENRITSLEIFGKCCAFDNVSCTPLNEILWRFILHWDSINRLDNCLYASWPLDIDISIVSILSSSLISTWHETLKHMHIFLILECTCFSLYAAGNFVNQSMALELFTHVAHKFTAIT